MRFSTPTLSLLSMMMTATALLTASSSTTNAAEYFSEIKVGCLFVCLFVVYCVVFVCWWIILLDIWIL